MKISVQNQSCPNSVCTLYKQTSMQNIRPHSQKEKRLRCKLCGVTWSINKGLFQHGLKKNVKIIEQAIIMLESNIPIRRIAEKLDVNPSTIQRWKRKKIRIDRFKYIN